MDRTTLANLPTEEVVKHILSHYERNRDLREVTRQQKEKVLGYVLRDFEARGKHLATLEADDVADYRAYLLKLTKLAKEEGGLSRNYAAHVDCQWNAAMRLVFGDTGKPGTDLIMRGFKQTPREVDLLTSDDHEALLAASSKVRFQGPHYAYLLRAYIEVAWCSGSRCGSLLTDRTTVASIRWADSTLVLGHLKSSDGTHTIVLTDRAVRALREWISVLNTSRAWRGPETPLFAGPHGRVVTSQWLNQALKRVAAVAGIRKRISTHVFRHTAGTLIGRENPKLAIQQLGVTDQVFQTHYNRPRLEDRLHRRDVLPGSDGIQASPMERLGAVYWRYAHGLIDKIELDQTLELTRLESATI